MGNPNSTVDRVSKLSVRGEGAKPVAVKQGRQPSKLIRVEFQGGQTAFLDMSIPRSAVWMEVLDSLRELNQPAYVEINPETKYITELLCPLTVNVGPITPSPTGEAMVVELIISHGRHYLRRERPDFQGLVETLETARKKNTKVLVTETLNEHEIIDVRPIANLQRRKGK